MDITKFDIIVTALIIAVSATLFLLKCLRKNGIVLCLLFILLYALAAVLKLLFLSFVIISFFFILLLNLSYYVYLILYFRNKRLKFTSFSANYINPVIESEFSVAVDRLPPVFFGMYNLISFDLYEKNAGIQSIAANLNFDNDTVNFKAVIGRHGFFDVKNISFLFRDIFGFTQFSYPVKIIFNITVHPFFTEPLQLPFLLENGGEEIIQSITKIESTDFFENRKYFPGDDIRRINWKVYAHLNELHIREVEKIPPKIGQISIFFAPFSSNYFEYELISSLFISTANVLLRYGLELKIKTVFTDQDIYINKIDELDFKEIINNSYQPFNAGRSSFISNSIVFASYEEFVRILDFDMIKSSFCAVSIYKNPVNLKDMSLIYKIDKFDNIFIEFFDKIKLLIGNNDRENSIERIKNVIDAKKIKLLIYETTGKDFEQYNQI